MAPKITKRAKDGMRALIAEHDGNLSAIAAALGCSRQFAARKLAQVGLADVAAMARASARLPGPRPRAPDARRSVDDQQRIEMLRALAAGGSDARARALLGMSRRSFYRAKRALKIDSAAIAAEQQRLLAS